MKTEKDDLIVRYQCSWCGENGIVTSYFHVTSYYYINYTSKEYVNLLHKKCSCCSRYSYVFVTVPLSLADGFSKNKESPKVLPSIFGSVFVAGKIGFVFPYSSYIGCTEPLELYVSDHFDWGNLNDNREQEFFDKTGGWVTGPPEDNGRFLFSSTEELLGAVELYGGNEILTVFPRMINGDGGVSRLYYDYSNPIDLPINL